MIRKIIHIDEDKCNGCGLCANACHEGAIGMVNGKARLLFDNYCDGLGDCLPTCPTQAISFIEREAAAYDEAAVLKNKSRHNSTGGITNSQLSHWPVQIKLAPINAPYFNNASLLIAADCTAYAYANFHNDFIRGKVVLIGCPKLDNSDYSEKLAEIVKQNNIKSLTIARMEVPCCKGIENAGVNALKTSEKFIPWQVVTISIDGQILDN